MMTMERTQRIIEVVIKGSPGNCRMRRIVIASLLLAGSATTALAADPAAGEKIFKAQCGICHTVVAGDAIRRIRPSGRHRSRLQLHHRPQEARHRLGRLQPRQIPRQSPRDGAGHVNGLRRPEGRRPARRPGRVSRNAALRGKDRLNRILVRRNRTRVRGKVEVATVSYLARLRSSLDPRPVTVKALPSSLCSRSN
jgi:hypothetical protein